VGRRTRLIVKVTATAAVIASVVTARLISDDDVANFGVAQAALFLVFGVASIVLFAVVVTDFDRWTETLPPVPKGVVRRVVGRATKRVRDAGAVALAVFGAGMTWFWSRVGAAIGTVTAGSARRLTRFWSWVARAEGALLARVGSGLAWFWTWAVRGGVRALIAYGAVMHHFWTAVGHGFAWTAVQLGASLTWFWTWAVRGGARALVLYRAAMQWVWSTVALAARWVATRTATVLRVMWTSLARGGEWTLRHCRSALRRAWLAVAGRGDEVTPRPIRRWYTATVDAAFGIPPDGTSVDVFGGRVAPVGRETRTSEPVGAPARRTPEGADDDAAL